MDKSIELIKEVSSLANQIKSHNQATYDFFIKMVEDGKLNEEDFYKLALIANKEKICREVKNCLTIEKKKREIIFFICSASCSKGHETAAASSWPFLYSFILSFRQFQSNCNISPAKNLF